MVEGEDEVVGDNVGVVEDLLGEVDSVAGDVGRVERFDPVSGGSSPQNGLELLDGGMVGLADLLGEPVIGGAFYGGVVDAERVAEGAALAVVQAGDGDEAVPRLVDAVVVVAAASGDIFCPKLANFVPVESALERSGELLEEALSDGPVDPLNTEDRTVLGGQARGEEAGLNSLSLAGGEAGVEGVRRWRRP